MSSIPGLNDEVHAHLSDNARERLRQEREVGAQRVAAANERMEAVRRAQAGEQSDAGTAIEGSQGIDTGATADALTQQRIQAHEQRLEAGDAVRQHNARVNAEKELADAREEVEGRAAPTAETVRMAEEVVAHRTEQAKEIGLQAGMGFVGHPETSEVQAEAARANAAKEVADKERAANYDANSTYQGVTEDVVPGKTDEWGEPILEDEEGTGEAAPPQESNGQPPYNSVEQTGAELLAGTVGNTPRRNRRSRGVVTEKTDAPRAVGDGPPSE